MLYPKSCGRVTLRNDLTNWTNVHHLHHHFVEHRDTHQVCTSLWTSLKAISEGWQSMLEKQLCILLSSHSNAWKTASFSFILRLNTEPYPSSPPQRTSYMKFQTLGQKKELRSIWQKKKKKLTEIGEQRNSYLEVTLVGAGESLSDFLWIQWGRKLLRWVKIPFLYMLYKEFPLITRIIFVFMSALINHSCGALFPLLSLFSSINRSTGTHTSIKNTHVYLFYIHV